VDGTSRETITVRYHDDLDQPLQGDVGFYIAGDPRGADLSAVNVKTDAEGLAHVDVLPGIQTSFQVSALATYAAPVAWDVTIGPGGTMLDATGTFTVASQFALSEDVPGQVAQVTASLRDMIDGPNDPGSWVLDQLLVHSNDATLKGQVTALRPGIDELVNYQLERNTPGLVELLGRLAGNLDTVTQDFGSSSTLTVSRNADGSLSATHDVGAFRCTVEGDSHTYGIALVGASGARADGIKVMVRGKSKVYLDSHQLLFPYGHFLRYVLEHLIVPALLPGTPTLGALLQGVINCNRVGFVIASRVGGQELNYENACLSAIGVYGDQLTRQLDAVTAQAAIEIRGNATPIDADGDGHIDRLDSGQWQGSMTASGGTSTLSAGQSFSAQRQ
jgi:hypothetical protein